MKKNKKNTEISFLIRTRNEERWVGHAIQSILDRVYRPEILIVDNKSTDDTLRIVKYFQHDPLLNELDHPSSKNYTNIRILNIKNYTKKTMTSTNNNTNTKLEETKTRRN